ncbi:MAG: hypothetical protein HOF70_15015 [Rhodospirillaceae bacterium]|jgi:hypothetical protein|nr:hypothetical protein [Rhodospirillaceae bacterium]MBT4115085.1 hypothetical protein [Rhodospirillaceae bacterium]MBT4674307.1 hypothetical protein [Rhodospirillaceae bacterium]MBT4721168.1 hypothetical protein [Rhodospirillaceae bacterium]MBT5178935.1 hypothetical protein [Rhodospirillaceae bacterium]
MSKHIRLGFALLLVGALGACESMNFRPVANLLAPAPLPQYKVGDKFTFKIVTVDDVQEVTAVNGDTVTIKSTTFGTLTQQRDFSNPESWTGGLVNAYKAKPNGKISGLFPLKTGNQVKGAGAYEYNTSGTYDRTCTVNRQISVPTKLNAKWTISRMDIRPWKATSSGTRRR